MHTEIENYLFDAIDVVLSWEIPEEGFADAVRAQACLMSGNNSDDVSGFCMD